MNEPDCPEYEVEQKNQRLATRTPLIVEKIPIEDGQKTFFGYAKNISRGGLFIATVKPREIGDVFTIEVEVPDDESMAAVAAAVAVSMIMVLAAVTVLVIARLWGSHSLSI